MSAKHTLGGKETVSKARYFELLSLATCGADSGVVENGFSMQ